MNFGNILSTENFNYVNLSINTNDVNVNSVNIVFNFNDEQIQSFISFDGLKPYASRIIYNFPNAKSIKIDNTNIYGTIIAPNADVEINNGELLGQIIAKSLKLTWVNTNGLIFFNGEINTDNGEAISISNVLGDTEGIPSDDENNYNYSNPNTNTNANTNANTNTNSGSNSVPSGGNTVPTSVDPSSIPNSSPISNTISDPNCKEDEYPFGMVSNFGAFSFNDFIAFNSDVQCRIAAKNYLEVNSYSINEYVYGGNRYSCNQPPLNNDFPYAIVAGRAKIHSSGAFNGGIAYTTSIDEISDDVKNSILNNGCKITNIPNLIDYDSILSNLKIISNNLASIKNTGCVSVIYIYIYIYYFFFHI